MSLHKIVIEVTDSHERDGVIDRHQAINDAVPRIMADEEMTTTCVRAHVSRLIAQNAKARRREMERADAKQSSLFGLRAFHVVEDGEGKIKETRALSRIEFQGLISVRLKQLDDDLAYLNRLRDAAQKTAPLWDAHPDWTWGMVEDTYQRFRRAA